MTPPGKSVILLEDDDDISDLLSQLLRSYGAHPVLCATQEDTLKAAENPDVAMALLDIMLPGVDGRDVATALRASKPDLPLYFMTGIRSQDLTQETIDLATEILYKPFPVKKLRDILDANLDQPGPTSAEGTDRKVLEIMTLVATEQENLRRKQSDIMGFLQTLSKEKDENSTYNQIQEKVRNLTMSLEASMDRFAHQLGDLRKIINN